jgi:hypothetical protein
MYVISSVQYLYVELNKNCGKLKEKLEFGMNDVGNMRIKAFNKYF